MLAYYILGEEPKPSEPHQNFYPKPEPLPNTIMLMANKYIKYNKYKNTLALLNYIVAAVNFMQ
jgi:hypothetical protein